MAVMTKRFSTWLYETGYLTLEDRCKRLEAQPPMTNQQTFEEFNLLDGHTWEESANSDISTYYPCLYGIVKAEHPKKILEIGSAFGLSAATMLKACSEIELFISIDLGIYSGFYGFSENNIDFVRYRIHTWCVKQGIPLDRVRFYRANTQPSGKGDNEDIGADITRWHKIPDLVRLLELNDFDVIFVDGKHTGDGLLNDLNTFWPFLKPGGLILCDDLHDEVTYKGIFPWAGDTVRSFENFLKTHDSEISDSYIWNFPQVPPVGKLGLRPFGLIRKRQRTQTLNAPGFEMFDSADAIEINKARQDHLASLKLDLAGKTVLEVGAEVGWHTAFFEKLGCSVLSTDAREVNVTEHRRRYPNRSVEIADLNIPGSHDRFGEFDIVYCYGTLYHLSNPSLYIKYLARICRSLLLIETCVNLYDNGEINLADESKDNPNQSFEGIGCRPGRDWLISELKKYFPYVYTTVYQPDHPDFPLNWPAVLPPGVQNARSVFVASMNQLNISTLSPQLFTKQRRLTQIIPDPEDIMRIGIDLRSLQTGSQYRGIGYYTYNLVKAMCKIDKTSEYIFFANERADNEKFPLLDSLVAETGKRLINLPTTRIQDRNWKRMWENHSTPLFFRITDLDIIHVTSLFESELAIGIPSCGSKLVVTLYDLIPLIFKEFYLDSAPPDWKREYLECLELVRNNSDGIIAISECTKRDAVRLLDSPEKKIEVVYGGISDTFYIHNDIELIANVLKKFNIDGSFILFTAAEDFRKNLDTLIRAFAILKGEYNCQHKLVIIGRSSVEWRTQLLSQARILGIEESSLKFTGFVTDEELNLLYNAADLFVFPSLYEGFGLPILEAMACGVPVIAANNSSIPEVCGDAAILVNPMNKIEIAQSMNNVLSSHTLQQELREKGFQNIKRFSWENAAEKTLAFYERIANMSLRTGAKT